MHPVNQYCWVMKKILLAITLSALITGCAMKPPREVKISTPFDAKEASIINKSGKNTISGSALLKRNDGQTVTCAGADVRLVPYTTYANTRMLEIYGGTNKGFQQAMPPGFNEVKFIPDDPNYHSMRNATQCNAQGFFSFKNVADGDYFVITSVVWTVGYNQQGGALMKRVSVKGGEAVDIVLSP